MRPRNALAGSLRVARVMFGQQWLYVANSRGASPGQDASRVMLDLRRAGSKKGGTRRTTETHNGDRIEPCLSARDGGGAIWNILDRANRNQFGHTAISGRKPVRKQALMFASCSLWVLFLSAPACLAQSAVALDKPSQQEERMKSCLESTCRNVPLREKLTAINLSKRYVRGIFGGFEQGAGIAGGVQL